MKNGSYIKTSVEDICLIQSNAMQSDYVEAIQTVNEGKALENSLFRFLSHDVNRRSRSHLVLALVKHVTS